MNRQDRMIGIVAILIGTGPVAMTMAGPVTTAFTYQGNLMEFGELVNGSADFEFTLWDALVAGNQVGAVVSVDAVGVETGQFSVEVDFGVNPYTTNQALWLEIDVRSPAGQGQFETLAPRQELTPTPFSLATRGIIVDADGDVGIGTSNPSGPLDVVRTDSGNAGQFVFNNDREPGAGVRATSNGTTGSAALSGFATGAANGLFVNSLGSGRGVVAQVLGVGSGNAGYFRILSTNNDEAALFAETRGTGLAGHFVFDNDQTAGSGILATSNGTSGSSALSGSATGSAHGLAVTSFGSGRGVLSQVFQPGTGNAGYFRIRNPNSNAAALFCQTDGSGLAFQANGTARVDVLEVMGADIAEKFPVSEDVTPGTVMEIDPDNAGKLRMARGAYNRRVAGVVSGAGGLPVGAVLGNLPGNEDAPAIALSGRVWVKCDASRSAILIGDLLTTADKAGCAMAVADQMRASGATLGKAMTSLDKGEAGLVLVLVNLQ